MYDDDADALYSTKICIQNFEIFYLFIIKMLYGYGYPSSALEHIYLTVYCLNFKEMFWWLIKKSHGGTVQLIVAI